MAPRFRLHTFGTLRLSGAADDTVLGDHGHQRRRLALLAVLAAAGETGRSRDQLLGLFWPEAPQARARHSLEQMLYVLRTSIDSQVFQRANPLQLDASIIGSDVAEFTDALDRGELERAVELYKGLFLEGFYLGDVAAFDEWMESERRRFARSHADALERLANRAKGAADWVTAAHWRRKLVDADPLSSTYAIGFIRALADAGDHAAALRHAEQYGALVARELDTSAGPEMAALVEEVRARAASAPVVARAEPRLTRDAPTGVDDQPVVAPTGANATSDSSGTTPVPAAVPSPRRRPFPRWAIAVSLLATFALAAWWLRTEGASETAASPPASSLVVLPLSNLSGDPGDAVLADGITEELIGVLSRIDRLRVIARTSAFAFRDSPLDVRRIADSLGVANVLEGSMQKVGPTMRVQVRLIDARDGSTRWSQAYDRVAEDIFAVQRDIAGAVARELDLRLGARGADVLHDPPTRSIAAYELYLRGSDPALLRSDSAARRGMEYFRQAIALDSTYAAAHAGLARLYLRSFLGGRADSASAHYELGRQHAARAVALDDSLAEGLATMGAAHMVRYRFADAEDHFMRALALDPAHARTREWLSTLYLWTDRPAEALAEANRAVLSDPLSPSAHAEVGRALCANGEYSSGLERLRRLESVRPPLVRANLYVGLCHLLRQEWPQAIDALGLDQRPVTRGFLGYALGRDGQREEALAILAELLREQERRGGRAFAISILHAGLGNHTESIGWLERAQHEGSLLPHVTLPLFDELKGDPRFDRFRRELVGQKR